MRHVHALTIPKGGRTCPFLALSIPGERPFVVRTDVYKAVIKGIHVTDTSLEKIKHEKFGDIWALTILHNSGKVHGRTVLYNLLQTVYTNNYYSDFRRTIAAWAGEQKKLLSSASKSRNPNAEHERQIKRCKRN